MCTWSSEKWRKKHQWKKWRLKVKIWRPKFLDQSPIGALLKMLISSPAVARVTLLWKLEESRLRSKMHFCTVISIINNCYLFSRRGQFSSSPLLSPVGTIFLRFISCSARHWSVPKKETSRILDSLFERKRSLRRQLNSYKWYSGDKKQTYRNTWEAWESWVGQWCCDVCLHRHTRRNTSRARFQSLYQTVWREDLANERLHESLGTQKQRPYIDRYIICLAC